MELSNMCKNISDSLTLAISAKASKLKAEGRDVIGFGAGEPDFDTPEYIKDAARKALAEGITKYTPVSGLSQLKEVVVEKFEEDNGLVYKPDQIIVSSGAKHSLFNTFQVLLNPGDEVLIPVPYWVSYPEIVKMAGGKPVFVETGEDMKIKPDMLEKHITGQTKVLILNSPGNPTGAVYNREELIQIADIVLKNNIIVISDEIYEYIVYDDNRHISIASLGKEIKEQTVVINGMSKAYAMTGWRIGFAAASEEIVKGMSNYQSHSTSNPNSIAQYASITALQKKEMAREAREKMVKEFSRRRLLMYDGLKSITGLNCQMPGGAFYILVAIDDIIGKKYRGDIIDGSLVLADKLLEAVNVAVVPGIAFGRDSSFRLSYVTSRKNIIEGIKRIASFIKELE